MDIVMRDNDMLFVSIIVSSTPVVKDVKYMTCPSPKRPVCLS